MDQPPFPSITPSRILTRPIGLPAQAHVLGIATVSASVSVNGSTNGVYRRGEYFRKEQTVTNTSAVWHNVSITTSGGGTNGGYAFVPATPEVFVHDADGNLTQDGRFTYTWDAENRLTKAESLAGAPQASKRRVTWEYDAQGRRIRQTTYEGSSGSYLATEDLRFLADGWRHFAELNPANTSVYRLYAWGLDLGGSLDGAGGVGGLLWMSSATNGTHFAAYDGNGNVTALAKATDGTLSASYEYGPFGEVLRLSGSSAKENPFRFSSKRANDTTDLVLYEYRVYSPCTGRWANRDPIEELGGLNLYGFVGNDPIGDTDYLGQWNSKVHLHKTTFWAGVFFKSPYNGTIGNADQGVDALFGGHSSLGPEQDRHMYYLKEGKDSRDWWYDTEFAKADDFLARADKENNVSLCAKAAEAFGRGLHSRQDRSAHRPHPNGGNWPAGRMHPGWWDAWDESDYTAYGWSDVYWRKDINKPPLYYPWAEYASEAAIQVQQRQLQEDAKVTVIGGSFGALGEFEAAVRKSCLCKKAMLLCP